MSKVTSLAELVDKTQSLKNCVFRGVKGITSHKAGSRRRSSADATTSGRYLGQSELCSGSSSAQRFDSYPRYQSNHATIGVACGRQHYGLPTRLLDWTSDPLVAAYFACSGLGLDEDSGIYAVREGSRLDTDKFRDPFSVRSTAFVVASTRDRPSSCARRIVFSSSRPACSTYSPEVNRLLR